MYRTVRLFVSSTFIDMKAERDYITESIFPRLEDYCRKHMVDFVGIDLRWGITEEESNNGYVLTTCLREVEESRPFFVGLLGERYGWQPSMTAMERVREQMNEDDILWIEQNIKQETSITEMEFYYGALRDYKTSHAAFLLRSPQMPTPPQYNDSLGKSPEEKSSAYKLAKLKQTLSEQHQYAVQYYHSVEDMGEKFYRMVCDMIDAEYGKKELTDSEYIVHQQDYILNRFLSDVVGFGDDLKEYISDWLEKGSRVLLVEGADGSGKSTTSALLTKILREGYSTDNHVYGYYNFEADTRDLDSIEALKLYVNTVYNKVSGWCSLTIDGVLLLEREEIVQLLEYLNQDLPEHIHILMAVKAYSFMSDAMIYSFSCSTITQHSLQGDIKGSFINAQLKKYYKKLTNRQIDLICKNKISENPWKLKLYLDSLMYLDSPDRLQECLEKIHSDRVMNYLIESASKKYDALFGNEHCSQAFTVLATTKGVTEKEVQEILNIPDFEWSQMRTSVLRICRQKGRYYYPISEEVSNACMTVYFKNMLTYVLGLVAKYFEGETIPAKRKAKILPYLYYAIGMQWNGSIALQNPQYTYYLSAATVESAMLNILNNQEVAPYISVQDLTPIWRFLYFCGHTIRQDIKNITSQYLKVLIQTAKNLNRADDWYWCMQEAEKFQLWEGQSKYRKYLYDYRCRVEHFRNKEDAEQLFKVIEIGNIQMDNYLKENAVDMDLTADEVLEIKLNAIELQLDCSPHSRSVAMEIVSMHDSMKHLGLASSQAYRLNLCMGRYQLAVHNLDSARVCLNMAISASYFYYGRESAPFASCWMWTGVLNTELQRYEQACSLFRQATMWLLGNPLRGMEVVNKLLIDQLVPLLYYHQSYHKVFEREDMFCPDKHIQAIWDYFIAHPTDRRRKTGMKLIKEKFSDKLVDNRSWFEKLL